MLAIQGKNSIDKPPWKQRNGLKKWGKKYEFEMARCAKQTQHAHLHNKNMAEYVHRPEIEL